MGVELTDAIGDFTVHATSLLLPDNSKMVHVQTQDGVIPMMKWVNDDVKLPLVPPSTAVARTADASPTTQWPKTFSSSKSRQPCRQIRTHWTPGRQDRRSLRPMQRPSTRLKNRTLSKFCKYK